ncbi:MAG: M48 family metalloprotease [bacterium]|nr:M48 family metalloprotease [bacterium]
MLLFCLLVAFLSGCAVNPVTGKKELTLISESSEIALGAQNYGPTRQSQGGEYILDPQLTAYVSGVGQRIARISDRPDLPYEFTVLNNSTPNAWALPGGKIAINRGMLTEMNSEAELAAVLAHEVVHAAARHSAKSVERGMLLQVGLIGVGIAASNSQYADILVGVGQLGLQLISTTYRRNAELESDYYGMNYRARAGYDPKAAVTLQETFLRLSQGRQSDWLSGLFASHPPSRERVNANLETLATLPQSGTVGADTYQRMIAGIKRTEPAYKAHQEARKALSEKNPAEALRLADQAIRIEPREALFYGVKGDAKTMQEDYEGALRYYDEAVRRNSQFFQFVLQRGLVRDKLGDYGGARADLEQSLTLFPTAHAHYALGNIGLRSGDKHAALEHYRLAASSSSEVGKAAAVSLARLELPDNPGAYIAVKRSLDQNGYLVVSIKNQSPVPVRNIAVAIGIFNERGGLADERTAYFRRTVAPGQVSSVSTRIGPFADTAQLRYIRLKVVGAAVAE